MLTRRGTFVLLKSLPPWGLCVMSDGSQLQFVIRTGLPGHFLLNWVDCPTPVDCVALHNPGHFDHLLFYKLNVEVWSRREIRIDTLLSHAGSCFRTLIWNMEKLVCAKPPVDTAEHFFRQPLPIKCKSDLNVIKTQVWAPIFWRFSLDPISTN